MKLPTIETPKYALTLPSTGKTVEYRPFLVKEEKILLIAQQSEDTSQSIRALKDVVQNCTFGSIDISALAPVDLEYIFLQVRAKSVGEISEVSIACKHCETPNPVSINLEEIIVETPKKISNKIKLTPEIGVVTKPISTSDIEKISALEGDSDKQLTATIIASLESIFDVDNVYPMADVSFEEADKFINSLNREQMSKIEKSIENSAKLKYDVKFTCTSCKKDNETTLEGLQSFFE